MFLKCLDINGFKSFADKTHIDFSDGITSLLGPNGCGKSNIVDSIKWVLGEQSTKTLRAGRMEDVIFNGTDTRKPLQFAEVALTIDNSEHKLQTDLSEIEIKRRVFRTGESEYYLNRQRCLLKNIRELFSSSTRESASPRTPSSSRARSTRSFRPSLRTGVTSSRRLQASPASRRNATRPRRRSTGPTRTSPRSRA